MNYNKIYKKNLYRRKSSFRVNAYKKFLVKRKSLSEVTATKETNGRFTVYKHRIKTVIGKNDNRKYVVSDFDFEDTKQEAIDSIKSVNALYGYTPKFLEIYA